MAYKVSHLGNWEGQAIDSDLAKGLTTLEEYLELNKQPDRAEKIAKAMTGFDPMFDRLNSQIQEEKQKQLKNLWRELERFAHHSSKTEEKLRRCLGELEKTVFYLLAPITAEDQKKIQKILGCSDRSENDVEQMFSLIERRGANFVFFFKRAAETADATWLPFLNERGYFADPPNVELIDDNRVIFPFWWPIHYLAKIAKHAPNEVIEIVRGIPKVDNPRVYNGILEIALSLQEEQSAALRPKILESLDIDYQAFPQRYEDLLVHWVAENQTSAALELTKVLVGFMPTPQSESEEIRRRENPLDLLEYDEIMSKGVRPLAEKTPYQVICLLIDATANMIHLDTHRTAPNKEEDASELWCERLSESNSSYEHPKATLVHTLTFACEQVYEKSPDSVVALDKVLRDQQWGVFKRLRQHLYARYPSEQTKPWIQELILEHKEYHLSTHHYEFQQMVRSACEHFKKTLLTESERSQIFDAIFKGPSKEDLQKWLGEEFTEEKFEERQRSFHRQQFKPFESLLFGKYATYFQQLEAAANNPIADEDYLQFRTEVGWISDRSPRSSEDLEKLRDEELLSYINEWEGKERFYEGDLFVDINIEGLAEAFQAVFKDTIIPDANRLRFWIENRERIARPIYVRMMISGMQTDVKEKNFDKLNEWLIFSEWVLSHTDQDDYGLSDESRENPNWHNSRRAIGDFIRVCLEEDVDVPLSAREQLAKLLEMLCTQFDSWLDRDKRVYFGTEDDPTTPRASTIREAVALRALVGLWTCGYGGMIRYPKFT